MAAQKGMRKAPSPAAVSGTSRIVRPSELRTTTRRTFPSRAMRLSVDISLLPLTLISSVVLRVASMTAPVRG